MNDQTTSMTQSSTDLALERTRLAKERTFAAVVRTALSFIGFGIAVGKLLPDLQPGWIAQTLAFLLILGGGLIVLPGFRATLEATKKLHQAGVKEPHWHITATRLLLLVAAILALLAVGSL